MKKLLLLLTIVLVILAGCSAQPEAPAAQPLETKAAASQEAAAPAETAAPAAAENVKTVTARAKANHTPVLLAVLNSGDKVETVGNTDGSTVIIKTDKGFGQIGRCYIRLENEPAYDKWEGFTSWNDSAYKSFRLVGSAEQLKERKVTVLDELDNCYAVSLEDKIFFVEKTAVSHSKQYADPAGAAFAGFTAYLPEAMVAQTGDVTGNAAVKVDAAECILTTLSAGQEVTVVTAGEAPELDGYYTVLVDGMFGFVRKDLVEMPGDAMYEKWNGYARWNAVMFENMELDGEVVQKLFTNLKVTVLDEIENAYLVTVNGKNGYVQKDRISPNQINAASNEPAPAIREWSDPTL